MGIEDRFYGEASAAWKRALQEFDAATELSAVICGGEVYAALQRFRAKAYNIAFGVLSDEDATIYSTSQGEYSARVRAVRKELGIEDAP